MRLIDARRLVAGHRSVFTEFFEPSAVAYATLSHRWEDDEVKFQELEDCQALPTLQQRKGYLKIRSTCERALEDCIHYVWIDTCGY